MTFLDAGAGTGKTTRLVHRVLADVLSGEVAVTELAVITFTEKAAAELRDRIRIALARAAHGRPALNVHGARELPNSTESMQYAARALAELHRATICTLHAFAQRLLDDHRSDATVAATPQRTRVLDAVDQVERFARRWPVVAERLLTDVSLSAALDRSVALGVDLGRWELVARELDDNWDRCQDWLSQEPHEQPHEQEQQQQMQLQPSIDLRGVIVALQSAAAIAPSISGDDKLAAHILELVPKVVEQLVEAEASGDDFSRVHALTGALLGKRGLGTQTAWGSPARLGATRELLEAPKELLSRVAIAAFMPILRHLAHAAVVDAHERLATGSITFHDILVAARDLMVDDPSARLRARRAYRRLLIDEFQDTDPLQADLALALAWDGDRLAELPAALPTGLFAIEADRLTFVGDPKQSIYRFRRADIDVYERMKARFPGEVQVLNENRRSRPEIVAWVNAVFGKLFARDDQVDYEPLVAVRGAVALEGPGVAAFGGPLLDVSNDELRAIEAAAVTTAVHDALQQWTITDPSDGSVRRARPSDLAVLLRTRSILPDLEQELIDAGIPYRIESKGHAWESQDVVDVLTILAAIDDSADPAAIVAALRGRVLGCDDDALLAWQRTGGRWDLDAVTSAEAQTMPGNVPGKVSGNLQGNVVSEGLAWLRSLHQRRFQLSVPDLVRTVVAERALFAAALDRPRPRDSWARLQMLVDSADTFADATSTATLRRFLVRCAHAQEQGAISNERIVTDPDDEAIRILTIHAAKGLEFPIVIVAGLGLPTTHGAIHVRWDSSDEGIVEPLVKLEVRAGERITDIDLRVRSYKRRQAEDSDADAIEQERLAYVAATRARDHLVVSLFHIARKSDARGRRLSADLHSAALAVTSWLDLAATTPAAATTGAGHVAAYERGLNELSSLRHALEQVAGSNTTDVALRTRRASDHDRAGSYLPATVSLFDAPVLDDTTYPRRFGRAVHAVLELMPFVQGDGGIVTLVDEVAIENDVADRDRVMACVDALRTSAAWVEACAATHRWRELCLDGTIDGVVFSGQADLVWERPDGTFAVADWKNDPSDAATLHDRYDKQLQTYARLLSNATGRIVSTAVIVAVHPFTGERQELETLPQGRRS